MPVETRVQGTGGADVRVQESVTRIVGTVDSRIVAGPLGEPKPRCRAEANSGGRCKAAPIKGTDLCVGHTGLSGDQG